MSSATAETTLSQLERELEALQAELAKRELHEFVRQAWHLVEPDMPFVDNWHIRRLCEKLEAVSRGDIQRLLVNVPPGTMKTLLVSVFWPAWEWASNPALRFLTASYGAHLSIRDNLRLRTIVTSEWFQRNFDVELKGDQNAKERFDTTEGGWRIATSVGGVGTGEHPDRIIIDDPTSADQARSDTERESANQWFDRTMSSRGVTRNARVVIVMQRLHEDDLSGHLLERGGWTHLRWPMRYEKCTCPQGVLSVPEDKVCPLHKADPSWRPDPSDPRTEANELLWPSLFTEARVRQLELDLGPFGAAGQLQQRPAPEGGGLFKREWFKFVDAAPRLARRARGWDTAGTELGGDWTVGVRISEVDDVFYIEDVVREQLGPAGVDALMLQTAEADRDRYGHVSQREEKEGGSAGKAVIEARLKKLKGHDYAGVTVTGDKVTRAKPFRAQCEGGNVRIVRGPWNEEYLRELSNFPNGKHDDQVDGSSCAFNAVLLEPQPDGMATW